MSEKECCNQECNQGRTCPNRLRNELGDYAFRFYDLKQSLPQVLKVISFVLLLVLCVYVIISTPEKQYKVYDCSLSEISPDYPIEVKEECRKLRAQK